MKKKVAIIIGAVSAGVGLSLLILGIILSSNYKNSVGGLMGQLDSYLSSYSGYSGYSSYAKAANPGTIWIIIGAVLLVAGGVFLLLGLLSHGDKVGFGKAAPAAAASKARPVSGGGVPARGMMVCYHCGKQIPEGAFCPYCGQSTAKPVVKDPKPEVETIFCPQCGKKIKKGSAFCPYCGKNMGGKAPAGPTGGPILAEPDLTTNDNWWSSSTDNDL